MSYLFTGLIGEENRDLENSRKEEKDRIIGEFFVKLLESILELGFYLPIIDELIRYSL